MSHASDIIIGKVVVDYYTAPGEEVSGTTVQRLTEYVEREVMAALEEQLATLKTDATVWSADSITVHLPNSAENGWGDRAAQEVRAQLEGAVSEAAELLNKRSPKENRRGTFITPESVDAQLSQPHSKAETSNIAPPQNKPSHGPEWEQTPSRSPNNQVQITHSVHKQAEAFRHYLVHGVLPWYARVEEPAETSIAWNPTDWDSSAWAALTQTLRQSPSAKSRWILRGPTSLLEAWVAYLTTEADAKQALMEIIQAALQTEQPKAADRAELRRYLTEFLLATTASIEPSATTHNAPTPIVLQSMLLAQSLMQRWERLSSPKLPLNQWLLVPDTLATYAVQTPPQKEQQQEGERVISNQQLASQTASPKGTAGYENSPKHPKSTKEAGGYSQVGPLQTYFLEPEALEVVYQPHAGVMLLHAFLPSLFTNLSWLDAEHQWRSQRDQVWAAYAVHYLASGEAAPNEAVLFVAKLLMGWPLAEVLPETDEEDWLPSLQREMGDLLKAIHHNWAPMDGCSWDGLRHDFLSREGKVARENDAHWKLTLEKKVFDMLLQKITWSITYIQHPWMPEPLVVEWDWA